MKETDKIKYIEDAESFEGEYKKIKKQLRECKKEKSEYLDGWQRARAEFQNYKKQNESEAREIRKFASDDAIMAVFPILDNMILAAESVPEDIQTNSWTKGILHIKKQLEDVLASLGVEEMIVTHGTKFDPAYHEAIDKIESDEKSGTVVEVLQKGYILHGKVLRAARIRVAK